MRISVPLRLPFTVIALSCCPWLVPAQSEPAGNPQVEQHIQHVTSGLMGGVVIKGDEHATHSLTDRCMCRYLIY